MASASTSIAIAGGGGSSSRGGAASLVRTRQAQVSAYLAKHPMPNIVLALTRNKNQNFVCYAANLRNGALDASNPLRAFWLDIEPSYQAAKRKKGIQSDSEPLNAMEKRMAYGYRAVPRGASNGACDECAVSFVALPKRSFLLRVVRGVPRLIATLKTSGDVRVFLQRVHVNESPGLVLPTVHDVTIIGHNVVNGSLVEEVVRRGRK